jgi:hypothetical protein
MAPAETKNFTGLDFDWDMETFPCGHVNGEPVTAARRRIS